ncbi:MAG: SpoIID/LytB domain-containing protein [Ruminococcaceae bacterium]|nr:SpoIID/LytB domain-containing protein [Oscillospiraceae bacterium]
MRLYNFKRFVSILLALVFCAGMLVDSTENLMPAEAAGSGGHIVRVGMYANTTTDTRMFCSKTDSASGFEMGYSDGTSFIPSFSIPNTTIYIMPQVNADFVDGSVRKGDGNVGSYSLFVSKHGSFGEASSKAKSVGGFVAIVAGGFEVRKNPASSAEAAGAGKVVAPAQNGLTVLDANGKILFTFENTGRKFALRGKNGSVEFPMIHRTGAVNTFAYWGFFEYGVSDGLLTMVNCLGLEDYTKCIMANEIGTNVTVETRTAFAILARTTPLGRKHRDDGFDVCCNSACCQVYQGLKRMSEENNAIVDATKGMICTYNGSPITVLYHNSNGGASCSSVAAWGGKEIPYLTTVFLDEDGETDLWERSFTKEEFADYIASRSRITGLSGDALSMTVLETDPYGSDYITVLSLTDDKGNTTELRTAEFIRSACGFDSANFRVEYSADVSVTTTSGTVQTKTVNGVLTADGYKTFNSFDDVYETASGESIAPDRITIKGQGAGHGVGFSALGSDKLATDGYSHKYILEFFFNGSKITDLY